MNVRYAHFAKEDLKKAGHYVLLSFSTHKETRQNLDKVIIAKEVMRRKEANLEGLAPTERKDFVLKWTKDRENKIIGWLGSKKDDVEFLNKIFFAPSFVKTTVPHLKKVFMADVCHFTLWKYKLFSCYGITANSNACLLP